MVKKQTGTEFKTVGRNVDYELDAKGVLHIHIDTKAKGELSKSEKTLIFATTQGNKKIEDFFVGLNAYRYAGKKKS